MSRKPCGCGRAAAGLWSQCKCAISKQQVSEGSKKDLLFLEILERGEGWGGGGERARVLWFGRVGKLYYHCIAFRNCTVFI